MQAEMLVVAFGIIIGFEISFNELVSCQEESAIVEITYRTIKVFLIKTNVLHEPANPSEPVVFGEENAGAFRRLLDAIGSGGANTTVANLVCFGHVYAVLGPPFPKVTMLGEIEFVENLFPFRVAFRTIKPGGIAVNAERVIELSVRLWWLGP